VSDRSVEVLGVELFEADAGRLLGLALDKPIAGQQDDGGYVLDLRGWVLGRDLPVTAVEAVHEGRVLRRMPVGAGRPDVAERFPGNESAESSGFYASLGLISLPREFELQLDAIFEDGARVSLGVVRARRPSLRSAFEPSLAPLMVTSPGRTGSTVFMQMLEGHPEIVAYPPFEHEPRVATYWIEVFKALAEPAGYLRQVSPSGTLNGRWWLGERDPVPRRLSSPELQAWLSGDAVEEIAAFCQARIEALYEQVAAPRRPAYFAEKFRADDVPEIVWELYPATKEVLLVRDLRDVACSIFAATGKRGVQDVPADRGRYVAKDVQSRVATIVRALEERGDRAHLVRYEDLMLDAGPTLERLLDYLGLDAPEQSVAAMLDRAARPLARMETHRTTPDPAASIGRWRRDLTPELQAVCEEALGPANAALGYTA
jgi:hypothetical protein